MSYPAQKQEIKYTNAALTKLPSVNNGSQNVADENKIKIKFKVPKDTLWQALYWVIFFVQLMIILYYF